MAAKNDEASLEAAPKHRRIQADSAHLEVRATASVTAEVRRGKESWAYIYTWLGFALTIETGVVALITPLKWPANLLTFAAIGAFTVYLFLDNGWFQNKLIGLKAKYEEKLR